MSRDDGDMLGERLKADLRGMIPDLPNSLQEREQSFLDRAHAALSGQTGRRMRLRIRATAGSLAAAAAIALGVTIWQTRHEPPRVPVASVQEHQPTIVDAMIAARRGAKPAEVDQIAMAAVRLGQGVR